MIISCPKCKLVRDQEFYGPCIDCRADLVNHALVMFERRKRFQSENGRWPTLDELEAS